MCSARIEPSQRSASARRFRPGLRARVSLWTTAVLAASLGAGFAWVHHNLRGLLEARNDTFLVSKSAELTSVVGDDEGDRPAAGPDALEAEIRREVSAYARDGLVVVVWRPGDRSVFPPTETGRRVADRLESVG